MDVVKIGKRIKQARENRHIHPDELASRIGIHKATLYRYENGDFKSVKLTTLEAIASVLKVSPAWLAGKTDDPTPMRSILDDREISAQEKEVLDLFDQLNDLGKEQALIQLRMIASVSTYTEQKKIDFA